MKFWKFAAADLSTVLIDQPPHAESASRILSGGLGIGGDQLAGVGEQAEEGSVLLDAQGNDGPSLLSAVLAKAAWQKRMQNQAQGTIRTPDRWISWFIEKNGIALCLPRPQVTKDFIGYYGQHECRGKGILPWDPPDHAVHRWRLIDAQSFYLDSSVPVQGRICGSAEGALCAYACLREEGLLSGPALALCEGGRFWIRPQGKALILTTPVFFIAEGSLFEN